MLFFMHRKMFAKINRRIIHEKIETNCYSWYFQRGISINTRSLAFNNEKKNDLCESEPN